MSKRFAVVYDDDMLRLRVRYQRARDFLRDHEGQLAHHGLFVRVAPPADLSPFAPVALTIELGPEKASVNGQAVQITPEVGVAVSFSKDDAAALVPLVDRARRGGDDGDQDPVHENLDLAPARTAPSPPSAAAAAATKGEKIQRALRGTKDERLKIIRDHDKTLHLYVLKNPRLGLDEVAALAKTATTSVEVLKAIAERREWFQRPEIALGLVRNPKTPPPIAIRMLDHISKQELRRLAKSDGARMAILQAARKKVIGNR